MARRRRRAGPESAHLLLLLALLGPARGLQQHELPRDFRPEARASVAHLCDHLLPHQVARHLKLCKLIAHSPKADEAVARGAQLGLAECRLQFRAERWNCEHAHGEHHLLTGELAQSVGNREGAFVQAIAAAGVVHGIATACSSGAMDDCACDKTRFGFIQGQKENFKWGGCSMNIKHGMLFAKHLVELLDAVHQHARQVRLGQQLRRLHRRSLSSRHREPNQLRGRPAAGNSEPADWFCHKNQNISAAAHVQLIRSLLARNSLEKHPEFRLAMNMHNNKVGRMAVARHMGSRCRCHGLSGSCSLRTCWLTLPDFEKIGSYLKKKYESSVHLPTAVNVNKLIPMMDRDEISAILSGAELEPAQSPSDRLVAEKFGPSEEPEVTQLPANLTGPTADNLTLDQQHGHYEIHKSLLEPQQPSGSGNNQTIALRSASISDELPANIAPMTQQQYQALLRDMKLCNNNSSAAASYLSTRDLSQPGKQIHRNKWASSPHLQQQLVSGQHIKNANQQLAHLLQANNRDELIHLHKSPDYCEADAQHGFAGIKLRVCNAKPSEPDNCDKLCCGRGYTTHVIQQKYRCDCKFQYCCSIWCSVCQKEFKKLVCN